jgi:glycosyltransferase involved in cell wall biosynthesis
VLLPQHERRCPEKGERSAKESGGICLFADGLVDINATECGVGTMKVTVGLPFFNAEADLPTAIRSVFAQTHEDWELLLIDDGSTDRSLDVARSVRDERVTVVSDGQNRRLAARLNQIVDMAQTEFIVRMDADDLMAPERIGRQLAVLIDEPQIDIVSSGLVSIDRNGRPFGARTHFSPVVTRDHLVRKAGTGIVHAAVVGRRAWFLQNRYDPNVPIAQDYDLWLRSSVKLDIAVRIIQEPLYYVRELDSVTPQKMLRAYRMDRRALRLYRRNLWEMRLILKSFAKSAALKTIVASGGFDWLVRRRSRLLTDPHLISKINADIAKICSTAVPGLPR